jgi:hypothetical protein
MSCSRPQAVLTGSRQVDPVAPNGGIAQERLGGAWG